MILHSGVAEAKNYSVLAVEGIYHLAFLVPIGDFDDLGIAWEGSRGLEPSDDSYINGRVCLQRSKNVRS